MAEMKVRMPYILKVVLVSLGTAGILNTYIIMII